MPSNARWRRVRIVEIDTSKEISGGLKNALDRGETLARAKQSFLNAGYTQEEVQAAVQKIPSIGGQVSKPLVQQLPPKEQKSGSSRKIIIILSVVGAIILIIALVLGIFWDKIF